MCWRSEASLSAFSTAQDVLISTNSFRRCPLSWILRFVVGSFELFSVSDVSRNRSHGTVADSCHWCVCAEELGSGAWVSCCISASVSRVARSGCGMVLVFHSSCRFRHATLCVLHPGLAHAAHPAVLPISSQKISENCRVGVPTDRWSMPILHPDFRLTVLSPLCPRCTFHTLDETPDPDILIILRSKPSLLCKHPVLFRQCAHRSLWLFQAKCLE